MPGAKVAKTEASRKGNVDKPWSTVQKSVRQLCICIPVSVNRALGNIAGRKGAKKISSEARCQEGRQEG